MIIGVTPLADASDGRWSEWRDSKPRP
jgi:hypothetical protein